MTAGGRGVPPTARIKAQAFGLGFDLAGIAALGEPDTAREFDAWLASGYAGEMHYLERGAELRRDARRPEPGMRFAIVVALNYGGTQPPGPIARYARGDDYHAVMHAKLDELGRWLSAATGGAARTRSYVDTGPVLERDLARRAGLGWFGKNTNLINPGLGSFFFIGALFTDAVLEPDAPFEADRCGTCTRCLDACPTHAFTAPRTLDATRCISYLTIELKGDIPEALRPAIGELLYGCDICQDVCPWNISFARDVSEPALQPHADRISPDAAALLALSESEWRARFGKSAMTRAKRRGLARNAAVALGNRRDPSAVPALAAAADDDPDPVVRAHAQWALAQFE
ncbi:MAG TPA: tRNA epoxyqueuosine(34) reductase QueG [Gemmatimonadaceae bacterium]|nr:tRNA epoxyqueuosine(34) reductase QueG [Gemmatimonadaceae bacterium]